MILATVQDGFNLYFIISLFCVYFIPSIVASCRKHRNESSIMFCNFFFGWTFIGWVLCLIWSFSDNCRKKKKNNSNEIDYSPSFLEGTLDFDTKHSKKYKCLYSNEEVKGTFKYIHNVIEFAKGRDQSLIYYFEPDNVYDPNAIEVYGKFINANNIQKELKIGYVDKHTAKIIAEDNVKNFILLLKQIWCGGFERQVIYVKYKLIVPKEPDFKPKKTIKITKEQLEQLNKQARKQENGK